MTKNIKINKTQLSKLQKVFDIYNMELEGIVDLKQLNYEVIQEIEFKDESEYLELKAKVYDILNNKKVNNVKINLK